MWPGPRPTCMPSFVLIRPTIWPQCTNVTDRQTDRQRTNSIGWTVLQTVVQKQYGLKSDVLSRIRQGNLGGHWRLFVLGKWLSISWEVICYRNLLWVTVFLARHNIELLAPLTAYKTCSWNNNSKQSIDNFSHPPPQLFYALFGDHPGEPVPEENFWTLWCKGRFTEADTLTIPAGRHSIRTNQCPPPPSPFFSRPVCVL